MASAHVCGGVQKKIMRNNTTACHHWWGMSGGRLSVMTAHPTTTGMQPASPPHTMFMWVRRFKNFVYTRI